MAVEDRDSPGELQSQRAKYAAPAAACAADVLRMLKDSPTSVSLAQLERGLERSKSLIFRVLRELEVNDFVRRDETGRYRLAIGAFEIGAAYLHQSPFVEVVSEFLQAIATDTGDSVNLGVLAGPDVLYLMNHHGASTHVTISRVGGRVPATCIALGKALLAERSDDEIRRTFHSPLSRMTPKSVRTVDDLLVEMRLIRKSGVAWDREQAVLGRSALAITIRLFGLPGETAGISISTRAEDFSRRKRILLTHLRHAREVIHRDVAARIALAPTGAQEDGLIPVPVLTRP